MLDQQELERIRFKMQRIRRHMDDDIQRIQEDAEQLLDWKYYLRRHPIACVAAVAAAGFMLVPARRKPAENKVYLDPDVSRELANSTNEIYNAPATEAVAKGSILMSLGTLAVNTLIRTGLNYATQRVKDTLLSDFQPVGKHPAEKPR